MGRVTDNRNGHFVSPPTLGRCPRAHQAEVDERPPSKVEDAVAADDLARLARGRIEPAKDELVRMQ